VVANFGAEGVGAGRGKQRVDLAPGKEHQSGQHHEPHRIVGEHIERPDARPSMPKAMNIVFSLPIMSEIPAEETAASGH